MNIFLIYSFQFVYNFDFIVFILYLPASYKINDDNNLCPLLKLVTVGNPRFISLFLQAPSIGAKPPICSPSAIQGLATYWYSLNQWSLHSLAVCGMPFQNLLMVMLH